MNILLLSDLLKLFAHLVFSARFCSLYNPSFSSANYPTWNIINILNTPCISWKQFHKSEGSSILFSTAPSWKEPDCKEETNGYLNVVNFKNWNTSKCKLNLFEIKCTIPFICSNFVNEIANKNKIEPAICIQER